MTEDEIIIIRKIEQDIQNVLTRVSSIELIKNKDDILKLHDDLIVHIEIITDTIKKMKSPHAIDYLAKAQYGLIEMLAMIETM